MRGCGIYRHMQLLFTYFTVSVLGLLFGSFMAAWIYRQCANTSILRGRSACTTCQANIAWYDNIPVISFVCLRGACRSCRAPISKKYLFVELSTALVFLVVTLVHAQGGIDSMFLARDLMITFFLLFIFFYDLWYMEIWSEQTVYPAIALFILSVLLGWQSPTTMLIGAAVGGGVFYAQFAFSKGQWVGGGDVRLGLFMGVILGWPLIVLALMMAYVLGAIIVLPFLITKKVQMAAKIPFGTYLTVATFAMMLWGDMIWAWYRNLIF